MWLPWSPAVSSCIIMCSVLWCLHETANCGQLHVYKWAASAYYPDAAICKVARDQCCIHNPRQ